MVSLTGRTDDEAGYGHRPPERSMTTETRSDPAPWWDDKHRPDSGEVQEALAECHEQLAVWGLTMPSVKPTVVDFGLGDFRHKGLIQYTIANEVTAGYCGKFLFVFAGQTCACHQHGVKHETFVVVKGEVTMHVAGEARTLSAGDTLAIPTGVNHSFTGATNALLLEVSMPSSAGDNRFTDRRIGNEGVV